jgi:hypothetical protein
MTFHQYKNHTVEIDGERQTGWCLRIDQGSWFQADGKQIYYAADYSIAEDVAHQLVDDLEPYPRIVAVSRDELANIGDYIINRIKK